MMKKTVAILLCSIFLWSATTIKTHAQNSAKAAITIEAQTGISLYEKNADEQLPMASTTKIMTALVALENADINQTFTVSETACKVEGTQIGLLAGDQISLNDLLHMLMMKSANDAAQTIAENISGSLEAFAELMNERAKQMGLTHTHFENPHGLPSDNHYTTARELALISAEALKNDTFAQIVSTKKKKLDYHGLVIENSNRLLSSYEYTTGVKTGFTKAAGRCLVTSAKKDGVTLINVTLNDGNDWQDHTEMFEEGFRRVSSYTLYEAGQYSITVPVLNGTHPARFTNPEPVYGVCIDGQKIEYIPTDCLPQSLYAPIQKETFDQQVYVELAYKNRLVGTMKLTLCESVAQKEDEQTFSEKYLYYLNQVFKSILP